MIFKRDAASFAQQQRTLVVHYHPSAGSLTRAAAERVVAGVSVSKSELKVLDLADFDPALSLAELRGVDGGTELEHHWELLQWATRIVLVYPTWWGGQPAVVKGWFDRAWALGVAYEPIAGKHRIRGLLTNIGSIDIVTTHGSPRSVNLLQGSPGRVRLFRTMRACCGWRCRTRWMALYNASYEPRDTIADWLDDVERRYQ